jgi:predicted transcriptional regulator
LSISFGEDCVYASKRRQGGKVETHSNLVRGLEVAELEEVVIAVVCDERDQEQ